MTTAPQVTARELLEAHRLLDPDNEPNQPSDAQVSCVARVVVLNPALDEIANGMAQIQNIDLRQAVMTFLPRSRVLDLYMRFAPRGLSQVELSCIRQKFTQLDVGRPAEVMVEDPDAGYTGPLVIRACTTGSTSNPLATGTIPGMGDGWVPTLGRRR